MRTKTIANNSPTALSAGELMLIIDRSVKEVTSTAVSDMSARYKIYENLGEQLRYNLGRYLGVGLTAEQLLTRISMPPGSWANEAILAVYLMREAFTNPEHYEMLNSIFEKYARYGEFRIKW
jgi:hypothetical protein